MPRRRVPRPSTPPLRAAAEQQERKADGDWMVRAIRGTSTKDYRCPGCSQLISRGLPHLVVWPVEKALLSEAAIDERRHWHKPCWARRH
ncbi:hypothetical protein [Aeromicrobium sp. UC242_57]|uniref:hypothetical protein n=1 Tax=Aeromicrobium sp. UC242_57 TaxID=3374624 RepID=UPI0037BA70FD